MLFRSSNDINIVNGLTVTGNGSGQLTLAGQISGSGPVVKSGTHTTVITGNNTYTGGTAINGGSVIVNNTSGSGLGSGNVTINNATLTGTGTVSGNVAVNSGGVLAGTLTVGDVVVGNGGVFAPGSKITSTSTTWQGGGEYAWSIANTLTGAGIGWDLASINGTLSIQSSLATPFLIAVSGTPANFNTLGAYSFAIATASGGISGFDESKFQLDVSGFGISTPVGARWWVSNVGNSIYVNYAIPEPSTIFLFAAGVTLIGIPQARKFWQRRTRR